MKSKDKNFLRTKVIKEYAIAISELETAYYKTTPVDSNLLLQNKTRKMSLKSDYHRWMIHALQEHGLKGKGVTLNYFMEHVKVGRTAALYILKGLAQEALITKGRGTNEKNQSVNFYFASDEMIESYLDFTRYIFRVAERTAVGEKFTDCMVVDKLIGLDF